MLSYSLDANKPSDPDSLDANKPSDPDSLDANKPSDPIKTQYEKLSEDWRQLNTMLWAIPSVAISIMAGIIVVVYQHDLDLAGWQRFVLLAVSSLFLLALSIEVIKKNLFMTVISDRLNNLQKKYPELKNDNQSVLDPDLINPTQFIPDPKWVVKEYPSALKRLQKESKDSNQDKRHNEEKSQTEFRFFPWLHRQTGRGRVFLAWVIFLGAISVGFLAVSELYNYVIQIPHTPAEYCAVNPEKYNVTHAADCPKFTPGSLAQDCALHPEKFNVQLKQCSKFITR